jgi:hypothetical protein
VVGVRPAGRPTDRLIGGNPSNGCINGTDGCFVPFYGIPRARQLPDDRAGALGFEPPAPLRRFNRTVDLERLQQLADLIIADEEPSAREASADRTQVEDLMLLSQES